MASDSHEIKFTSDLNETITHKVEGPPDLDAAIQSHLKALLGEGNIPGAQGSPANDALSPATGQTPPTDPSTQVKTPDAEEKNLGPSPAALNKAIDLGASQANAAPAITNPQATPAGKGEVSNTLSSLQGMANKVGDAFGVLGTIAGGVAGKLFSLAKEAMFVGSALIGLTAAFAIATETIDSLFQALASKWDGLSPRAEAAKAVGQAELTAQKLKTERDVGGDIAAVTNSRTDLQSTFIRLSDTVIHIIAPITRVMNETLAVLLEGFNGFLKIMNVIAYPLQWALAHFAQFMEFIRMIIANDVPAMPLANFKNVTAPAFVHDPDLFYHQGLAVPGGAPGDQQRRDNPQLPNKPFSPDR